MLRVVSVTKYDWVGILGCIPIMYKILTVWENSENKNIYVILISYFWKNNCSFGCNLERIISEDFHIFFIKYLYEYNFCFFVKILLIHLIQGSL